MKHLFMGFFLILTFSLEGESLTLKLPAPSEGGHEYFPELLQEAMDSTGHLLTITTKTTRDLRDTLDQLNRDELDIAWVMATSTQESQFTRINFNLTKGWGGHQLLLIPREKKYQTPFDPVQDLAGFKALNLKAGILSDSRDWEVWKANGLSYTALSDSIRSLNEGLTSGDNLYQYIPRSILEAPQEVLKFPNLKVEDHLLLIFPGDFHFILSPKAAHLASLIQDSLEKADRKGVIDRLINLRFRILYEKYNLQGRKKLFLKLPTDADL